MNNLQCLTCGGPFKSRHRDARYCSGPCRPSCVSRRKTDRPLQCEICKQPETIISKVTGKPIALSLDHDHKTGKLRGFICLNCNHGLGVFRDNKDFFAISNYLFNVVRVMPEDGKTKLREKNTNEKH